MEAEALDPIVAVQNPFHALPALISAASCSVALGMALLLPPGVPALPLDALAEAGAAGLTAWLLGRRTALGAMTILCLVWAVAASRSSAMADPALVAAGMLFRWVAAATVIELALRTKARLAMLHGAADRDPLTGVYNRRGFGARVELELRRARRYQRPICLAYFDLDGFKRVNEEHGHVEGDRLLQAMGHLLARGRAGDVAARIGGDEFALLMPETTLCAAQQALERIRGGAMLALSGNGFRATFTVGLAAFPEAPESLETLLTAADAKLLAGKHGGRRRTSGRYSTADGARGKLPTLVADLRKLYEQKPCMLIRFDRLTVESILQELCLLGDWEHAFGGAPLTARRLSRMLRLLGIGSRRWSEVDAQSGERKRRRGYLVRDFLPLFEQWAVNADRETAVTMTAALV